MKYFIYLAIVFMGVSLVAIAEENIDGDIVKNLEFFSQMDVVQNMELLSQYEVLNGNL